MTVAHLNSSWGIDGKLAGCAGPVLGRDLACPAKKRIRALVRLAEEHEGVCGKEEVPRVGSRIATSRWATCTLLNTNKSIR